VSCAPSGDQGPTVYIQQKKKRKKKKEEKNSLFHVQIKIPVGCQIFRVYEETKNTIRLVWSSGCHRAENRWTVNMPSSNRVVHIGFKSEYSFALPPTAPGDKKQKNKNKNKLFHVQIKKMSRILE
jgi:hypothetical protein